MSDSKSGSKDNLNESNMPLLDDVEKSGETPEKEQIELKEEAEATEEKKDDSTEKTKKPKKEKKPKEPKGPNCIDLASKDLDLANRDSNGVNVMIDLSFDDVLAEPSAAQGFEFAWKLAFVLFSTTKCWIYKLLSAVVAVPLALVWAVVFALVSVVYIWIVAPALRLVDLSLAIVKKVVVGALSATVEPVCVAISHTFAKIGSQPLPV